MTKALMRLFQNEAKARLLVDMPRDVKNAVGPENDFAVIRLSGKAHAFPYQAGAQAESAGLWLDHQQTKLSDGLGLSDQKYATDDVSVPFGDPAALMLRIVVLNKPRHNLRNQRLEPLVPAVLLRLQHAMAMNDPSHVAWAVASEQVLILLLAAQ